jgi:ATP synthase protein I
MTAPETEMQAEDVRALRQSAVPTVLAGAVCVGVGAIVAGGKGALGAAFALVVVGLFFSVSFYAVNRAAKANPSLMMGVALGTYMIKIVVLAVLVANFRDTTLFDGRAFGFSAIALVLVWSGTQVRTMATSKMLYVEPRP